MRHLAPAFFTTTTGGYEADKARRCSTAVDINYQTPHPFARQ